MTESVGGLLGPAQFEAALKQAKADIARGTEANNIMTSAVVEGMRADPSFDGVRSIATLINNMWEISSQDILMMWAILVVERAEAIRDGG